MNNVLRRGRAKECKQVESSGAFVMETQSGAEQNGQDRIVYSNSIRLDLS